MYVCVYMCAYFYVFVNEIINVSIYSGTSCPKSKIYQAKTCLSDISAYATTLHLSSLQTMSSF